MDKESGKFLLKVVLWFFQIIIGLAIVMGIGMTISAVIEGDGGNLIMSGIGFIVYLSMYFIVIRCLILIIRSSEQTPFVMENVKRFKVMGICLLINSIFECMIAYTSGVSYHSVEVIYVDGKGAITPPIIICIIASLICFVMADVFKQAIKIKDENDLTV